MKKLTTKQQLFVEEYLISGNATDAARKAGYKGDDATLRVVGSQNITKHNIAIIIKERLNGRAIDADTTLQSLSDIATGDLSDFITVQGRLPILDFEKAEKAGKLNLIKKLTMADGKISFELYSKQRALETLAKYHGLLNTKIDMSHSGAVKHTHDFASLSDDELDDIINEGNNIDNHNTGG